MQTTSIISGENTDKNKDSERIVILDELIEIIDEAPNDSAPSSKCDIDSYRFDTEADSEYPKASPLTRQDEASSSTTTASDPQTINLLDCDLLPPAPDAETLQRTAKEYLTAGVSIIPVGEEKRPAISSWKPYQDHVATMQEVEKWTARLQTLGFAAICGRVSGNLEVIDIDDPGAKKAFLLSLAEQCPELFKVLLLVDTPKGGLHAYYRCEQIEGNQKLAWAVENGQPRILIETRGEGGYVVAPGADPRVHPLNKPYLVRQGNFGSIPEITSEQREALLNLARSFNQQVKESRFDQQLDKSAKDNPDQRRPGDDFSAKTTWEDLLTPFGWQIDHTSGEETYWIRPGKTRGVSATTNYAGSDKLVVFSTNTPFESGTSYSKFAAYAVLNHQGDYSKAAADLAQKGYGELQDTGAGRSQAAKLVALCNDVELFNFNDEAYATVVVDKHQETYRLNSRGFKTWLSRQYYLKHKTTVSASAMDEALQTLAGKALFEGSTVSVSVRIAGNLGQIYLDLGDEKWRVVEIDAKGWRVLDKSPVKFIRPHGMKPLPEPTRNGRLEDLRALINIPDDQDWLLLLSWMEYSLTPEGRYPVLAISGEQGSAKSTTSKIVRRLIDSNVSLLRSLPRDAQNLAVTAGNSWLLAFDNLSGVKSDMSDLLCSVSTGGGFAVRKLYENDEEVLFNYCRPILLNGISDVLTRPDMLDRTISIDLPAIDEAHRRCEDEIWVDFENKAGGILGALLTALSQGIARRGQIKLLDKPRMADFAVFATACERANGGQDGAFIAAYNQNRKAAQDIIVEGDILASVLIEWATNLPAGKWTGTHDALLKILKCVAGDKAKDSFFPRTARALSSAVKRLATVLRARGIEIKRPDHRGNNGARKIQVMVRKEGRGDQDGRVGTVA